MKYKCLSIAGFDGSGGAGLQADLKTFSAFGCYGMSVLTALPIQNTMGVKSVHEIPLSAIQDQLEAIWEDITPDAIKIGMLFNKEIVDLVAEFLRENAKNIPIILDPVMVAKSGNRLLKDDAIAILKQELLPLATLVTPNLPEAIALVGRESSSEDLSRSILKMGAKNVLLKGGHSGEKESNDLLMTDMDNLVWFKAQRISSKNTHGTGCTLSAGITAALALGYPLKEACGVAKGYLYKAIEASQHDSVGRGHGPVHHFYHLWPTLSKMKYGKGDL
jgi:hydroxymethylpyrimidine/phosphomethylpyrimidine kinase